MAIEDRNLEPGTKLIAKYKKEEYKAEVIAGEDGKVKYRLADGREFKSPSSAGALPITNKACNGWAFWSVEPDSNQTGTEGPESSKEQDEGIGRIRRFRSKRRIPQGSGAYPTRRASRKEK